MGSLSELFSRAAACERLMKLTADPMRKEILQQLREVWITLANERSSISAPIAASRMISRIDEIEARFEKGEEIRAKSPRRAARPSGLKRQTGKIWR